jgi:prepilin-type N-terminal cleavage/methylation domain-containing protein
MTLTLVAIAMTTITVGASLNGMWAARRARAFTLIEAMIVAVIVSILAVLAIVAYRRWTYSSWVGEAQDMVANIRSAQESFYAENGSYLNVSGSRTIFYPSQSPGAFKTDWNVPGGCANCTLPNGWETLNVRPDGPVAFGYSVIAGDGVAVQASSIGTVTVNNQSLDYSKMINSKPWYFVEAKGNISGDGVHFTYVYGMSGTNHIYIDHEGN